MKRDSSNKLEGFLIIHVDDVIWTGNSSLMSLASSMMKDLGVKEEKTVGKEILKYLWY